MYTCLCERGREADEIKVLEIPEILLVLFASY